MNYTRRPRGRHLDVDLAHIDLVRAKRRVLRDLRWRIRAGQHWLLQGANGAGKTQLLKLIAGDIWPQPSRTARRVYRLRGEASDEPLGVKNRIAYLGAERHDALRHQGSPRQRHRDNDQPGQRADPCSGRAGADRQRGGRSEVTAACSRRRITPARASPAAFTLRGATTRRACAGAVRACDSR